MQLRTCLARSAPLLLSAWAGLGACGGETSDLGPGTSVLARKYAYTNKLHAVANSCTTQGLLDTQTRTLQHILTCEDRGYAPPVTIQLTQFIVANQTVTFDADGCGHTGTISGEHISGSVVCPDISGTWDADSVGPTTRTVLERGNIFYLADAESGSITPPWDGPVFGTTGLVPVTSMAQAKNGTRSFKFEIPPSTNIASSTVMALRPQVSMGGPNGHFMSGYYSFWAYVDAGFNNTTWNMILGWMTGVSGAPSPISYIGLENWTNNGHSRGGSNLQVVFLLKNCGASTYPCPTIPGYDNDGGEWYRQTSSSPNGVTPFPRNQWVHLSVYYKMALSNGQVIIWQDGVKVMDLTAPTMNTFGGHSVDPLTNASGDMVLQHFVYGGPEDVTRRMYVDDFKVTDYRVLPWLAR